MNPNREGAAKPRAPGRQPPLAKVGGKGDFVITRFYNPGNPKIGDAHLPRIYRKRSHGSGPDVGGNSADSPIIRVEVRPTEAAMPTKRSAVGSSMDGKVSETWRREGAAARPKTGERANRGRSPGGSRRSL